MDAVVSDFGFARVVQEEDSGKTVSEVGPLRWMAPVLFNIAIFMLILIRKALKIESIQSNPMYGLLELPLGKSFLEEMCLMVRMC